ncbi:MAG: iron-containing alcohol dehydrogenase, partial [Planctomycetaceae bacterium]
VKAVTGVDALSHAIETYVTRKRNPISQVFSRAAWQQIGAHFPTVCREPDDLDVRRPMQLDIQARAAMQLGAHWAGAAIENSMLGAAHSLANPLSAHFDLTHGVAIGVMLPHVIRFNAPAAGGLYGELAADVGLCEPDDPQAAEQLATFVRDLTELAELPGTLAACGVDASLIPTMATEAAKQWTAQFNPRPVDAASLEELYRCALNDG